jgi:malonate transporter
VDVLWITLPIFGLIALGWAGAKAGLFDGTTASGLSRFVFWLAFPALLLTSMAKAPAPTLTQGSILGVWVGVLLAGHILGRLGALALNLPRTSQAGIGFAASSGNTAFLGTAILASLFGPEVLAMAAAFVALENILIVGLGVAGLYLAKPAPDPTAARRAMLGGLTNPVSMGALIGFLIAVTGVHVPPALMRPLDMLGAAASPAGLVALGIVMATSVTKAQSQSERDIGLVVAIKCIALPLMMAAGMTLIGAPRELALAATILAACPSAVNVFIQAQQAEVWGDTAARAVFLTTCVSIVTLSLAANLAV